LEDIFLGRRLQGTLARVSRPSDQAPHPPGEVDSAVDRLSQRADGAEPTTAGILVWAYIAGRQLDAWLADALADTGLSTSDYGALAAVAFAGDRSMTAGDLARWVVQTSGGTTKTLQRLVDRGLVRRVADTDDGRRTIVQPTAAGARRARSVAGLMGNQYFDLLAAVLKRGSTVMIVAPLSMACDISCTWPLCMFSPICDPISTKHFVSLISVLSGDITSSPKVAVNATSRGPRHCAKEGAEIFGEPKAFNK
jgi:DNA-binding MarR family transcriptional regulator